ncbi:MAG: hypothetical protein CUN53_07885 [Phototrophicales bacterium]|nr:MAG: hypothetical protein CUN53_07885 [Phototrophicales bacterium]
MFERNISLDDVREVVAHGEVIRVYPADKPFPSRLILGWTGKRPIHVVAADNDEQNIIIITVYEPDPDLWETDFKTKKEQDK